MTFLRNCFLLVFLIPLSCEFVPAQNWNALESSLDSKEKHTLDKALKSIKQAGDLIVEANNFYNDAIALQSDYSLDQETYQKELNKTESKAINAQIKADKLYKGAYKEVYELCKTHIKEFNTTVPEATGYETKADELMDQANEKRKLTSKNQDPYENAAMLNDASGLESAAIDNMIVVIRLYHGDSSYHSIDSSIVSGEPENTETYQDFLSTTNVDSNTDIIHASENLSINKSIIEKYDNYVSDPSIPDPTTVNRMGINGSNEINVDQARKLYIDYNSPDYIPLEVSGAEKYDQEISENGQDSLIGSDFSENNLSSQSYSNNNIEPTAVEKTRNTTSNQGYSETSFNSYRDNIDISVTLNDSQVRFVVQLAASRVPLTRQQLWAIYPGNLTVEIVSEGNWFKYRITGFRLFSDANRVALESGVKDAWVLSKQGSEIINLVEAREIIKAAEENVKRRGHSSLKDETDFYVQVAASRVKLSTNKILNLCNIMAPCREVIEEGWFKYQYYAGTNFSDAKNLRNSIQDKSFIVAYKGGTKIKP